MFRDLPRHDGYAANNSPWLGELPAHWTTERTKSLLTERVEKGYPDEALLAATQSHGVIRKSDYGTRTVTASKDLHLLKLVEIGDFVISLRSFQGGIERCYHRGIISPAYTVLTAGSAVYRDYLTFLFKSKPFISSLTLAVTGIREGQNIDYSMLAVDLLPVPPVEEQAAIVKYLTHANARIDKAAAAKRRLIALLDEQKIAVARDEIDGLAGPRVPLKRVLRSITAGVWGAAPEESDDEPRWCVRVADFDYGPGRVKLHPKTMRSIADLDFARKRLEYGDLLLEGSGGGDKTSVGRVVVFDHKDPAVCSNFLQRLRPAPSIDSEYLALVLRDLHAAGAVRLHIKQTTGIQNLDLGSFLTTEIPLPVESTQRDVVKRTQDAFAEIDSILERVKREIALLQEFRTRLVADVVTGQVDVRAIAAMLPDAPESFDNTISATDDDLEEALSEGEE